MVDDPQDQKPFGDWRIRLGITLGIVVFCMGVVVWCMAHPDAPLAAHAEQAWSSIRVVLVAMLGAAVISDWVRK